ncbi:OLC1v1011935C1 [Oldenlandia corymbosa var. corymbosa]|uniref:OLC1v1011935C1 n=1 Tax=Oldenlandia corymbosa var. corymbosa TaxID=529605 RepID=A0AAV1DX61_OLDCO|nr:OLC1v1011935C1 [Oldenlandia corymbosa var. corymbosa]
MAGLLYHVFSSSSLLSLGLYHLISTTKNHLKSPRDYSAKPYHPFPLYHRLRHLQLYLLILFLLVAFFHQTIISSDSDPLLKGRTPVYRFTSLQSAAVIFLFFLLSIALLLSESTSLLPPLPSDLFFGVASAIFFLHYSVSTASASVQTSDLQAECDGVSAKISALSSVLCLVLACHPKLFVADAGLAASLCLQGLWVLQTGLSLHVDAFIPEGCHKLLDVVSGVEGSTKCDLDDSKLRAIAILDLVFLVHVTFVVIIILVTYAAVAKMVGGGIRGFGSYEALPTVEFNQSIHNNNHIQMKALSGTQA